MVLKRTFWLYYITGKILSSRFFFGQWSSTAPVVLSTHMDNYQISQVFDPPPRVAMVPMVHGVIGPQAVQNKTRAIYGGRLRIGEVDFARQCFVKCCCISTKYRWICFVSKLQTINIILFSRTSKIISPTNWNYLLRQSVAQPDRASVCVSQPFDAVGSAQNSRKAVAFGAAFRAHGSLRCRLTPTRDLEDSGLCSGQAAGGTASGRQRSAGRGRKGNGGGMIVVLTQHEC